MRTFFTEPGKEPEQRNTNAVDIIGSNFTISIRVNGILIKSKNKNGQWEEADDIQINLE